jgi:hypothetical protein
MVRLRSVSTAARACCFGVLAHACSTEYAQTAIEPGPGGAGAAGVASGGAGPAAGGGGTGKGATAGAGGTTAGQSGESGSGTSCPESLAERLIVTTFTTDVDVRYKRRGYDWFPLDERIALADGPNGDFHVAWIENAGDGVRVTPLDANGERHADDVVLPGYDVGGLVAHDDGFVLLTRRDDPGEPLADPANDGAIAAAAMLVRVDGGVETFAAPLTGTQTIVPGVPEARQRDCAPVTLNGRLAFNGEKYGAYFQVHGCEGHPSASFYADKLVYADPSGNALDGGWDWGCSINQGIRLLPEAEGSFTTLCLSDGAPGPGLNLVTEEESLLLAREMTTVGFCAGQFGSLVRLDDGYLVGWLSRGFVQDGSSRAAEKQATDIAILRLDAELTPVSPLRWVVETDDTTETNLHLARYGDRVLVVWDSVENVACSNTSCFGNYTGTHARLMDPGGAFVTQDALIPAPPPTNDDIVVLPNGDLAWAFVPDPERDYRETLDLGTDGAPVATPRREIALARLRYCK